MLVQSELAIISIQPSSKELKLDEEQMYFVTAVGRDGRVQNIMARESAVRSLRAHVLDPELLTYVPVDLNVFVSKRGNQVVMVS